MIYLLYGPDTCSSRRKLRELTRAFIEKSGGRLGVSRVDLEENRDPASLLAASPSLFSRSQLLIIEHASAAPKPIQDLLLSTSRRWAGAKDISVIFWEGELGEKEQPFLAELKNFATKAQEFKPLGGVKLAAWLDAELARRELSLSPSEKRTLMEASGNDLWRLANELGKLEAGATIRDRQRAEEKIWNFTDTFFAGRGRAIVPLEKLLASGFETIYLLGALSRALRTLATVWWGLRSRTFGDATRHLHPFVVQKNARLAEALDSSSLRKLFSELLEADLNLKTGRLPPPLPLVKLVLKR